MQLKAVAGARLHVGGSVFRVPFPVTNYNLCVISSSSSRRQSDTSGPQETVETPDTRLERCCTVHSHRIVFTER